MIFGIYTSSVALTGALFPPEFVAFTVYVVLCVGATDWLPETGTGPIFGGGFAVMSVVFTGTGGIRALQSHMSVAD